MFDTMRVSAWRLTGRVGKIADSLTSDLGRGLAAALVSRVALSILATDPDGQYNAGFAAPRAGRGDNDSWTLKMLLKFEPWPDPRSLAEENLPILQGVHNLSGGQFTTYISGKSQPMRY